MSSATAWEDRSSWLELLEDVFDPPSIERLDRIGVRAGWQVLEAGAGRGSIARWLADRVGPDGRVVAADIDTRWLAPVARANLEVVRHDVVSDDFPADTFDLVHCRALLVHVLERERALRRMVRWLKPGGLLVAEEPWLDAGLLSPDPIATAAVQALKAGAPHMDGAFARRLPAALRRAGLERIEAEGKLVFFRGGTKPASFYGQVLRGALKPLVESRRVVSAEVAQMLARFEDPDWSDCGWPRIAAWGWKPARVDRRAGAGPLARRP
jgi:SAM-dependent methyltransferase